MPGYAGSGQAKLIRYNEQQYFWNGETITSGLSAAWELSRTTGTYYPWGFAVEVQFSGAPGAFEVDVMGSESDTQGSYVKLGSITTVNASNYGRFDNVTSFYPKFVALSMASLANGVTVTAKLTR